MISFFQLSPSTSFEGSGGRFNVFVTEGIEEGIVGLTVVGFREGEGGEMRNGEETYD